MNDIILPSLWCALQAAFIALVGIAVAQIVCRRHPELAASVAAAALATILLITALVGVPLSSLPGRPPTNATHVGQPNLDSTATQSSAQFVGFTIPSAAEVLLGLRATLSSAVDFPVARAASSHTAYWIVAAGAATAVSLVLYGMLRFFHALRYAARLRQHSSPLANRRVDRTVSWLARRLGVGMPIELRESPQIAGAAVVGWRRPAIILPCDWPSWTDDQLLAVLAHELAHVRRADFIWRLLAGFTRALHFYQPLTHWLAHQLTLSQEIAADRLAAQAMGDRTRYLKALSQLAISRDDLLRLRTQPVVLPALSTNLIRRINMLKATDCTAVKPTSLGLRGLAAGMIVIAGLSTLALRTSAEPPRDNVTREAIDISLVSDNPYGAFAVRLGELTSRPELRPLFALSNVLLDQWLRQAKVLNADAASAINLESIDYVAGMFQLTVKPLDPPPNDGNENRLMMGASELMIRFRQDVAWQEWIRRHLPGVVEKNEEGVTYFQYQHQPAFGPEPLLIAARDSRTIVLAVGLNRLQKLLGDPAECASNPRIAAEWEAVGGGVISIVSTDAEIKPKRPSGDNSVKLAGHELMEQVRDVSFAIDLVDQFPTVGLKCRLICADEAAAETVRQAMLELTPAAIAELERQQAADEAEPFPEYRQFWAELFQNSSLSVVERSDATYALEIRSQATFPLQSLHVALSPDSKEKETVTK